MSMKCAQCGTRLVPGSLSCANCGQQFATPVPPDPAPVQAAAAPPPQAPYGQAPQAPYGQAPQAPYGQAPQGQYGQAPVGGGPTPGPSGPQDPVKKYGPWVAAVVVAGFAYNHFSKPATPPAPQPNAPVAQPTQPQQPVVQPVTQPTQGGGDDPATIKANIQQLIALQNQFLQINSNSANPNDPNWVAQMEQNAQQLKSAADQGAQLQWPAQYAQAQAAYRDACSNYSYVGEKWPGVVQARDQAGAADCNTHLKAGQADLDQMQAAINAVGGGGATSSAAKSSALFSVNAKPTSGAVTLKK